MYLGPVPNWTLDEYRSECADLIDERRFKATAVDRKNFARYDCNLFEDGTTSSIWKGRWAVLSRWYGGIIVDTRFVDKPFVWCAQEMCHCPQL